MPYEDLTECTTISGVPILIKHKTASPDSGAAVSQGLREIVAGTGGAALYPFGAPKSASQVRNNTTYGVLKLTLRPDGYDWQFVPIAGSTFTDSGSDDCR